MLHYPGFMPRSFELDTEIVQRLLFRRAAQWDLVIMVSLVRNFPLVYSSVTGSMEGHMELQARVQVGEKGRIVIPAEIREAMGIRVGDSVELRFEDYELRVSTRRARIRRAQERIRRLIPPGVSLSEELSAERREAAKHE